MKEDKASSTAYTVLHGILHTIKNPKLAHLVDEETVTACTKILSATPQGRKRLEELHSPLKSKLLPFLEWLLVPGITLNYILRKKFIEENVLQAIKNGTTQIINIGAGFDTLAWRLSLRFPSLVFIEIDHPATSREKTKALRGEDSASPNLHFVAADLSKVSLDAALQGCAAFDSKQKTLYISEGVLMYLDEIHVVGLFDSLRNLTGGESIFIFSCVEPNESDKNNICPLLHLYLKLKNERYLWYKRDTELTDFLKKYHYTLIETADSEIYRKKYLPVDYNGTLHQGEYVVVARVD
ncbi:class I SAM-dependent methyltransferase [bacterium]|nr:class I SAM-dependent methyltransferase [bacterium]MBU1434847.1 class I SAM-dependent methyltransferase [bacterium]MBU1503952.1 class I SAM-dependent methyltransferase [bacterium]